MAGKAKAQPQRRPRYPMPQFIKQALREQGLESHYATRPPYQRNDYIGWITRAKQLSTRTKRLNQMLAELKRGDSYMNMNYKVK